MLVTLADPHQPLQAGQDVELHSSTRSTSNRRDDVSQPPFIEDPTDVTGA